MIATKNGAQAKKIDPHNKDAVIFPQQAVYSAVDLIKQRMEERESGVIAGVTLSIPELRDHVRPIYPGEFCAVCGLSRSGKTTLMKKIAYDEMMKIYNQGPSDKCIIFITWEESAEKLATSWLSTVSRISGSRMLSGNITRKEFEDVEAAAVKVGTYPIYTIGPTILRGKDGRRRMPDLNREGVERALDWLMNDEGHEPHLVVADYLQRVPVKSYRQSEEMLRTADWFKDLFYWCGAPGLLGTQAKQAINERPFQLPRLYDSEWTAAVGQMADVFYGVWMPKVKYLPGTRIDSFMGYHNLEVTPTLQFLGINKQKGDVDGMVFPLELKPDMLKWRMSDMYYSHQLAIDAGHVPPRQTRYY